MKYKTIKNKLINFKTNLNKEETIFPILLINKWNK